MDIASWLALLKSYGPYLALAALLVYFLVKLFQIVMDEDRSSNFRAKVFLALFKLTKKREHEKRYISNDINSRINLARRQLNHTGEILPEAVKVEWIPQESGRTYDIREGEFIVCLDPADSQEKNILLQINNRVVADWYFNNEYTPAIRDDKDLSFWNDRICEIDEKGLFTRILLVEFAEFSKRVFGLTPRPFMTGEIERLVNFLFDICTKKYGQDVPLSFMAAYIKIAVMLVALTSKILKEGIRPYLECIAINAANKRSAGRRLGSSATR